MRYRLLAADLDGTLVTDDKRITDRTKRAVNALTDRGGILVLASGRPTHALWPVASDRGPAPLRGYLLSENGGVLLDCVTGRVLFSVEIPPERIREIVELSRKHRTAILSYEGDDIITESGSDPYVAGEARNVRMNIKEVPDLISHITFPIVKLMMVGSEEQIRNLEPVVAKALGAEFSVFRSEAYHLEILPAGIDKGSGLKRTLEYLNIPEAAAIACGDYDNDIPMLKAAGLGVAMANGCPEIRKCADYITRSNEEDGVAAVIETFMLNDKEDI